MSKTILRVGLGSLPASITDPSLIERLRAGLERDKASLTESGFEIMDFSADFQGRDPSDANFDISDLEPQILKDAAEVLGSRQWDAVSLGFGLRGQTAYTNVFEGLVNAVLEVARPVPRLLFQARPDGLSESVARMNAGERRASDSAVDVNRVQRPKKVLTMGLYEAPGIPHQNIAAAIERDTAKLSEIGIFLEAFYVNLEGRDFKNTDVSDLYAGIVADARVKLKEKQWDAVSIGNGVRGVTELTPLFEVLANAVVEEVKPLPKMLFALAPDGASERVRKAYGM